MNRRRYAHLADRGWRRCPFLRLPPETAESVRAKVDSHARLGVFDLGLTPDQRRWVESRTHVVANPGWFHEFPGRDCASEWLRVLLARHFLRDYFPGADVYLWLDADTFVLERVPWNSSSAVPASGGRRSSPNLTATADSATAGCQHGGRTRLGGTTSLSGPRWPKSCAATSPEEAIGRPGRAPHDGHELGPACGGLLAVGSTFSA